ncbi:sulfated surface glycoprotein 185-like [Malania oleifera]|uniref:sulfated surface glycoprotein 185-like n=1 Tax=Malania oleifera TaxID=397392 RepID=UPI0025AEC275|nr:sulfated surface glycoprotein 185-like [Malania oleifera]
MNITIHRLDLPTLLLVFFAVAAVSAPRKLDENPTPTAPVNGVKCLPCTQSPPPPSPPLPPPPPPPSPSPPPPTPKKPPVGPECPPPPAALTPPSPVVPDIFIPPGPPGNLYPILPLNSVGGQSFAAGLPALVGLGLVGLVALW